MDSQSLKILAFHLPQFHAIPENDEWWGTGFTEWTNTKKAKAFYKGHHQPRTPLNEKYYNLLNQDDLNWEMDLASEYKLDGFCYYHYWFNGKLLLEKPLDIMRNMPNRMPYCFCWANEPWIRSWEGSNKILMEQTYPGEEDWKNHFEYLKRFFLDERYICIDYRPVLVLYKTKSIDRCDEMISYWDEQCKNIGFNGIYVIEEKNGFQDGVVCRNSKAYLEFEPLFTMRFRRNVWEKSIDYLVRIIFDRVHKTENLLYSYDRIWKNILSRKHEIISGKEICLGAYVDWDNTARKGEKSTFFYGATPEKFGKYMEKQVKKAKEIDSPFIFINAWNEWGEGTYLEPDERNGLSYLEKIKEIKLKEF